ncbi:hypothetical protein J437_LFUL018987 [Ladona fulva]|uniref:PiggyBac transposable element-derived protein domain-containing protein n=1 Tax=Ladona fulva TaxID=123851 RepID=A0A8K0PDM0_LADFU|nr:hypothetical protein J437_LFUL018987 [Ladona fulva]
MILKTRGTQFFWTIFTTQSICPQLFAEETHTTGTLRINRKNNPVEVLQKKLAKGEVICRWSDEGVCVLKWYDKQDVLLLSMEFGPEMIEVPKKLGMKPRVVVEYNNSMGGIDHFSQLMSYYTCEHRSLKWYKKIGIHIFQVLLLNSYFLYNKYSRQKTNLFDFRNEVIKSLLWVEKRQPSAAQKLTPGVTNKRKRKESPAIKQSAIIKENPAIHLAVVTTLFLAALCSTCFS